MMEGLHLFADNQAFFVVTSNGECHFELCGFAPEKIYEVEGNWLTMQCSHGCHNELHQTPELAENMAAAQQHGRVPSQEDNLIQNRHRPIIRRCACFACLFRFLERERCFL